ncbi:DUF2339 domain-containing protein [Primorskyibacter sp. 2E233]|uniref:DUF2339 domain-containing protein n=1 Tax=Primorskyibacter sp. 2E233 TaxID=3413431 RepID=UPI003BEFC2B1
MEPLLVLIGLTLLAIPVAVVYLLVAVARLKREMRDLSARLEGAPQVPSPVAPTSVKPSAPIRAESEPWQPPEEQPERKPWVGMTQTPAKPSAAVVFRRERFAALSSWLRENWFYVAAAVSLALSGIFLVQYGIENGLLPPEARVAAALAFGAALIGAGEYIRRRFGDDEDSTTAYLPSVLSGAGMVSLFGGVLAARMLYGLIGPGPAMVGLFSIALGGLVLGWFHGPLLAAIGLIGGMAAPFLVGGQSDTPEWLLLYFALLTALGLGIDTVRRWAWVSVLSLILGFAAGWLLVSSAPNRESMAVAFAAFAAAMALLATLIPARGLRPDHDGPCLLERLSTKTSWPIFPARLSLGSLLAACFAIVVMAPESPTTFWMSLILVTGLAGLYVVWSIRAPALQDHALLPAFGLIALHAVPDLNRPLFNAIYEHLQATETQTETRMIWDVSLLVGAALVLSLLAAWRSLTGMQNKLVWAGAAALIAPVAGLALEMTRKPALLIGEYPWALHGLLLGAIMTVMAERFARQDKDDHTRTSLPVLSALACLTFSLAIILTDSALTLALAATVLAAAALDRKFNLPLMGAYIAAGVVALGYRLTVDPGLDWATRTTLPAMLLPYGGTLAAFVAALWLLQRRDRPRSQIFLESAAWSTAGMTLSLTLYHVIDAFSPGTGLETHWGFGLQAAIWSGVALAQLHRQSLGGWMRYVRIGLASVFGLIAALMLGLALTAFNPLTWAEEVLGWPLLNTLIPAYLLPAVILGLAAWRLTAQPLWLRRALGGAALALTSFWAAMVIRHFWQGGNAMSLSFGVTQPELYSYTVALLLTGATLFYQALARRSDLLRRAGVLVIGLAVAKVFLIDISGLSGLVRVFSFLLLGLSLAGLAWLNRWVQTRAGQRNA